MIDFEELESEDFLKTCGVDEFVYLQNLKDRKIYLTNDIDETIISEAVRYILEYNRQDVGVPPDQRKPIILYISSRGGEVDAGFELIDAISLSLTPVYTVNLGYQYSMAFLIGLAGHKRFASENAKFLMHDGSNFIYNSGTKAQDQMAFNRKIEERIKNYVLTHSKISSDEYDSKLRVEWYMFADEAKEKGFTDYIVGKDCDLIKII